MVEKFFLTLLEQVATWIDIIGSVIMLAGFIYAFFLLLKVIMNSKSRQNFTQSIKVVRRDLGSSFLLGMEFMIAGDVIHTVLKPTLDSLYILLGIVLIRVIISYSLEKEMENIK